jgi:hypothetical protein
MTFTSALSASAEQAEEHAEGIPLWEDYLGVAFDPAHILAELTFTVFIDFVLLFLVWGLFFKKVLLPKIRSDIRRDVHLEIDAEHGVTHVDDDLNKPIING